MRIRHVPVLTALALWAGGCSRGATTPAPAEWRAPSAAATRPSAHQVFNDAYLVPAEDGTSWIPAPVNAQPGAVRVGETTREELLRRFGYPTQRESVVTGDEVWIYASALRPLGPGAETARSQQIAAQRKLVITFAPESLVVTGYRTYVTGERMPHPFRDAGPPFPKLEPPAPPARDAESRRLPLVPEPDLDLELDFDLEAEPIQPLFP